MRMKPENYAKLSPAAKMLYDDPRFEFSIVTDGEHAGMMRVSGWKKTMKRPEPAVLDEIKTILLEENAERDAARAEADRIRAEREARRDAIPGIKEIEEARSAWDKYHYIYDNVIADGEGRMPTKPAVSTTELCEKYPKAAAMLQAEAYSSASNVSKSSAGRKARERIIDGEDYKQVIADMEKEWTDYCDEHVWD